MSDKKRVPIAKAFRQEIALWKVSREEESLLRVFVASLALRMQGRNMLEEIERKADS